MADIEVLLPKMGESVAEATIVKWLKNEGDAIDADESIIEIATDKVDSEVPAPSEGVLIKKLVDEGDVVAVGQVIAVIGSEATIDESSAPSPVELKGNDAPISSNDAATNGVSEQIEEALMASVPPMETNGAIAKSDDSGRFYSPLVRSIAKKEGILQNELEQIEGSGQNGRVTKKDILAYIPSRSKSIVQKSAINKPPIEVKQPPVTTTAPKVLSETGDEVVEMDRMRKLIADHMVNSVKVAPHVTSFVEADVTNIVLWRNKIKNQFLEKYGEKMTFTPIFIDAVAKALTDFPLVNSSINGDQIIIKKNINIGMAAATPSGNLIVPVIRNANQLNLIGLTKQVNDLAGRARLGKLLPDEISGGTYTVSNVGTFGNVMGTPIINQPQSAILALGAIRKKPAVVETEYGDTIVVRHMMFLSHSYDHRNIDGALGGTFVKKVAEYLESFDVNQNI
ncbi:MAG: 2-oxo acid dehydrogenase subunit E2 [Crocinitomicaceae bacterium]|jgi:2-oxoglutarate dehydrogenase E2 component (dihydrolipoamide succinyltransferase)|nr:2-oxo acid dehydrogenase subunit E2 [Crocinitomicaceae bacterium]MBT5403161.1 2-oxo acid dehydrogenase subunit E2 [Crocinitomicaceae bacterium]MBT6029613.1 2-oxo acid dehydrogenase subunit E2 [Crocinitomicaceae bacterium]MBT6515805.1 2-oxo acid dehydrogenase subunit E2 [Crocinitomicaceae bacterium]